MAKTYPVPPSLLHKVRGVGTNCGRLTILEANLFVAFIEAVTECQKYDQASLPPELLEGSRALESLFKNQVAKRCNLEPGDEFTVGSFFEVHIAWAYGRQPHTFQRFCDDMSAY
jgi:hypothetical protein